MKFVMLTVLVPLVALFYVDRGHVKKTHYFFPCERAYFAGDCNQNGRTGELADVISMISHYRGTDEPNLTCECPPHSDEFVPTSDPDGNCLPFELSDVVTIVAVYRGIIDASGCPDCPPMD